MVERWSKVSDAQLKISSTGAGMILKGAKCANAMASDGSGILLLGGCKGYLDIALEEAERSRAALAEENNMLRRLFLRAVNDGQEVAHQLRLAADPDLDLEAVGSVHIQQRQKLIQLIAFTHDSEHPIPACTERCCI
jgi:hypothetical protein